MASELIPNNVRIPLEALEYTPSAYITFHGKGKKCQRFIFSNQVLTPFEDEKLRRLEAELKKLKIDPYLTHPHWTRNDILRFCYGTGWKTRVAVEVLSKYLAWHEALMPNGYLALFPKVYKLFETGFLYCHGRDMHFRPIIVVNFNRLDFERFVLQDYFYMVGFFLDYIINNMLFSGKVENWVIVSDFEKKGFGGLSIGSIKQMMNALTDNYRCRLGVNYVVNPTKTVYYIWTCIKPFLDEVLVEKVKILNTNVPEELFTHCNPYQVELKYGGKAPNVSSYWPPTMPEVPYEPLPNGDQVKRRYFNEIRSENSRTGSQDWDDEGNRMERSCESVKVVEIAENAESQENFGKESDESFKENQRRMKKKERRKRKKAILMKREVKSNQEIKSEEFKSKQAETEEAESEKDDEIPRVTYSEPEINEEVVLGSVSPEAFFDKIPIEYEGVENEKVEIGCSMCSSFPSMGSAVNKCIIF